MAMRCQTLALQRGKKVITVQPRPSRLQGGTAMPYTSSVAAPGSGDIDLRGRKKSQADRPELPSGAVVSGGRAMASRENFAKYLEPGGRKLGAASAIECPASTPVMRRTIGSRSGPVTCSTGTLYRRWVFIYCRRAIRIWPA